ncbi:MAG: biopolymer transporter ExbD [Chromatiaceae bacterium]|nr:biopolymer transporter ExbD [Chromatiaceae bacterium]
MKLSRSRPRATHDNHLIPLINVIFLMLIFFMVVGRIAPRDPISVSPPDSLLDTHAEPLEQLLVLGADGQLAMDGRILAPDAVRDSLARWREALSASGATSPARITLKADASLSSGQLRETLALLASAGIEEVSLLTLGSGQP